MVQTLAGDGISGSRDGKITQAEFMFPAALSYDPHSGALYIADPAAQRIRRLDRDGNVETVAGSGPRLNAIEGMAGGYADGNAKTARFNHPSGIAPALGGGLYIADAFNHCVRRIMGTKVSTFAGNAR